MKKIDKEEYDKLVKIIEENEQLFIEKGLLKFDVDNLDNYELPEFLQLLIDVWVNEYNTRDLNDIHTDDTKLHRSLGDIFRITKYYKPEVRLKDMIVILILKLKNKEIYSLMCGHIDKRTFFTKNIDFSRGYGSDFITSIYESADNHYEENLYPDFNLRNFTKITQYENEK